MLIDANILMYSAGAPHHCKAPSVRLLERIASGEVEAVIDAEALRELLHRYRAIGRWEDGRRVFDLARQLFPSVIPITSDVLDHARRLLDTESRLMARDALHAAVALRETGGVVCSYDHSFDGIRGVRRVLPPP
jgi:predicted nucleic acid-binding protein